MANIRFSQNPTGTTLSNNDLFIINQGGIDKVTPFSVLSTALTGVGNISKNLTYNTTTLWDVTTGNIGTLTLTGNTTLNMFNIIPNQNGVLLVNQDSVGNRTLSLPGIVPPLLVINPVANSTSLLSWIYIGNSVYWDISGAYYLATPTISLQPTSSMNLLTGATLNLSISASGSGILAYQWQLNGSNISSASAATYTVNSVQNSNGGIYQCIVSNVYGTIISNPSNITIGALIVPVITVQPVSVTANTNSPLSFNLTANGIPTPTYQWLFNNNNISGATSNIYTISNATTANTGSYKCVVTNNLGSVTSNTVTGTVNSSIITGLSAFWNLDETSGNRLDASGNGLSLIPSGATSGTGIVNNCVVFSQASQHYLNTNNGPNTLSITNSGFTFNAWFKITTGLTMVFGSKVNPSNGFEWEIYYNDGTKTLHFLTSRNGTNFDDDVSINYTPNNTWNMITCTSNSSQIGISVNNGAFTQLSVPSLYNGNGNFYLGKNNLTVNNGIMMNGSIDAVGIWSKVLNSTELTNLYNSGNAIQYPF